MSPALGQLWRESHGRVCYKVLYLSRNTSERATCRALAKVRKEGRQRCMVPAADDTEQSKTVQATEHDSGVGGVRGVGGERGVVEGPKAPLGRLRGRLQAWVKANVCY
jgi:hypothetical protein